jgi:hypothetical protein
MWVFEGFRREPEDGILRAANKTHSIKPEFKKELNVPFASRQLMNSEQIGSRTNKLLARRGQLPPGI